MDLVVKMDPCTAPRGPHITDLFAARDLLSDTDADLALVCVHRLEPELVADAHSIAIAAFPLRRDHDPVAGGKDRRAVGPGLPV